MTDLDTFGTVMHKNFIYVHFPKTGGHFINNFLMNNVEGCYYQNRQNKMMPISI